MTSESKNNTSNTNYNSSSSYLSNLDPKTKQIIGTQFGGFVSTSLFYPIDTVRCRTMSHDNTTARLHHNNAIRYRGIFKPVTLVVEHEGVGALYRGVGVAVGGATASWGIYMYLYKTLQEIVVRNKLFFGAEETNFLMDCTTSTLASIGCAYLTTPVWHVKTRMQLEDTSTTATMKSNSTTSTTNGGNNNARKYRGFFTSLVAVYKTDGFFGLWRGFSPQLLMSAVNGVYFPIYQQTLQGVRTSSNYLFSSSASGGGEKVSTIVSFGANSNKKDNSNDTKNPNKTTKSSSKPTNWEVAVASAGAKTFINVFSNPLFVLRTRLQDERHSKHDHVKYKNLFQSASMIMKQEGFFGFYKGLRAGLLITAPKSMMTMVVAENMYHRF